MWYEEEKREWIVVSVAGDRYYQPISLSSSLSLCIHTNAHAHALIHIHIIWELCFVLNRQNSNMAHYTLPHLWRETSPRETFMKSIYNQVDNRFIVVDINIILRLWRQVNTRRTVTKSINIRFDNWNLFYYLWWETNPWKTVMKSIKNYNLEKKIFSIID